MKEINDQMPLVIIINIMLQVVHKIILEHKSIYSSKEVLL